MPLTPHAGRGQMPRPGFSPNPVQGLAMADYARNRMFFASSTTLMLVVAAYMSFSLLWHDPVPMGWRIPLTVLLFLVSQTITGMRVLITWRPDLPFSLIRAGGFISSSFMVLSWIVLLRDALLALTFAVSLFVPQIEGVKDGMFSVLLSPAAEWSMFGASLVAAAFGMARALVVPSVKRVDVPLQGLPKDLEGLTIAHLSDLHIGSTFTGAWLEEVVRRTNELNPDFTLITGDLADGRPERIGSLLRPITELRARFDVIISVGNHDYYSGLRRWVETWRSWGMTVLLNEHRTYEVNGRNVVIAAVTDPCAVLFRSLDESMGAPDPRKALEGAGEGLKVLMSHRPGHAEQNAAFGCHLQLSGHTHGGQFFFLFPLVSRLNGGFRSGLYKAGSMPLYVSPGTGMWGYVPMRLGVGAEITLLTLRRAEPVVPQKPTYRGRIGA